MGERWERLSFGGQSEGIGNKDKEGAGIMAGRRKEGTQPKHKIRGVGRAKMNKGSEGRRCGLGGFSVQMEEGGCG